MPRRSSRPVLALTVAPEEAHHSAAAPDLVPSRTGRARLAGSPQICPCHQLQPRAADISRPATQPGTPSSYDSLLGDENPCRMCGPLSFPAALSTLARLY